MNILEGKRDEFLFRHGHLVYQQIDAGGVFDQVFAEARVAGNHHRAAVVVDVQVVRVAHERQFDGAAGEKTQTRSLVAMDQSDDEIGALPAEWNWLVGEQPQPGAGITGHFQQ